MTKSFSEIPNIIDACARKYLKELPQSVEIVFLVGNTDVYVKSCQAMVRKLFPDDFSQINSMAVKADGRLWVHLAHPSGLNGHFNTWLNSDTGSGLKRVQAKEAAGNA
jgi:hypothetical protein